MLDFVASDTEVNVYFCRIIGLDLALTLVCQDAKDGRSAIGIRLTGLAVNKRKKAARGKILFFVDLIPTLSPSIHRPLTFIDTQALKCIISTPISEQINRVLSVEASSVLDTHSRVFLALCITSYLTRVKF